MEELDELDELIKRYELEEDVEYVIIPFVSAGGEKRRCFLLKRRFITIENKDGRYVDYTLAEAIEAVRTYPDMKLSAALQLMHGDKAEKTCATVPVEIEAPDDETMSEQEDANSALQA
jgi:hypothetical protein